MNVCVGVGGCACVCVGVGGCSCCVGDIVSMCLCCVGVGV